ncbi:MAG: ABC transporter substrate-binding protein [Actinomycetota bacterium]
MRKVVLIVAACVSVVAVACAPKSSSSSAVGSGTFATAAECAQANAGDLSADATLTIGTGNPAYKPWYGGKSAADSEWKAGSFTGDPHSGEGYEAAFAYALADRLGFTQDQVQWLGIPFSKSFAPGPKDYDFAMQQISISEKRAEAVDFSSGYFDVNQALIANNGSPAIGVTTLAGLQDLTLGAPLGTTSLQVIQDEVQPNTEPKVYPTLDLALKAMDNGDVDGVVVDFPTAFYGYADAVVGQFPNLGGQQEQFGLAFAKGNGFVPCVDQAIAELNTDGTLDDLKSQWLETDANVPTFS